MLFTLICNIDQRNLQAAKTVGDSRPAGKFYRENHGSHRVHVLSKDLQL